MSKKMTNEKSVGQRVLNRFRGVADSLEESRRYRGGKENFFTFSPFQDTEKLFLCEDKRQTIKRQLCIRYVNKLDLTHPLAMNVQYCDTIQNYQFKNHSDTIINILNSLVDEFCLEPDKLAITAPDICRSYLAQIEKKYPVKYKDSTLMRAKLNIDGDHYYLKVGYRCGQRKIYFIHFVLVSFDNTKSQLDSIIFEDRLALITESVDYIFDTEKYRALANLVSGTGLSPLGIHEIANHYLCIYTIMSLGVRPGNKGAASELKRKIKSLFILYRYYYPNLDPIAHAYEIADSVRLACELEDFDSEIVDIFLRTYRSIEAELANNLVRYKKSAYSQEEAFSTLGIPKEEFGYRRKVLQLQYHFE